MLGRGYRQGSLFSTTLLGGRQIEKGIVHQSLSRFCVSIPAATSCLLT